MVRSGRWRHNGSCRFGQAKPAIFSIYSGLVLDVSLWVEEGQALFRGDTDKFCLGVFALDRTKHGYAGHSNRQSPYD